MPSNTAVPAEGANRYGAIAAEIYDLDKPYFALPDTAFHLERFAGFSRPDRTANPPGGANPRAGSAVGRSLAPPVRGPLDVRLTIACGPYDQGRVPARI